MIFITRMRAKTRSEISLNEQRSSIPMIKIKHLSIFLVMAIIILCTLAGSRPPVEEGKSYLVEIEEAPEFQGLGSLPESSYVILVRDLPTEAKPNEKYRVKVTEVKENYAIAYKVRPSNISPEPPIAPEAQPIEASNATATGSHKEVPGFGSAFTISALLAAAYIMLCRKC